MSGLCLFTKRPLVAFSTKLLSIIAFTITSPVFSATLDFETWKTKTLKENPEIRQAFHQWKSNKTRESAESSYPDPILNFDYFIDEVQTRTGAQEYRLSISQKLPGIGKLDLRQKIAVLRSKAAKYKLNALTDEISLKFARIWANAVNNENLIQIAHEELALLKQIERIALIRYRLAKTQHPDLIRIQIQIGHLENKLDKLFESRQSMRIRLQALTNADIPPNSSWPSTFPDIDSGRFLGNPPINPDETNPTLIALNLDIQLAESQTSLTKLNSRPDFTVKYGRIFTSEAINEGTKGSGQDPQFIGVGINIPIWSSKNSGLSASAHEQQLALNQKYISTKNSVKAQIDLEITKSKSINSQLNRFRVALIPGAEAALTSTLKAYQTGSAGFADLITIEKDLLDLKRESINLQSELWLSYQTLIALIGKPLEGGNS